MDTTATWTQTEQYYRQLMADWLRSVSRSRKYWLSIAAAAVAVGVAVQVLLPNTTATRVGMVLVFLGVGLALHHFWDRAQWFKKIRQAASMNEEVSLRFQDHGVQTRGPTSEADLDWRAFERAVAGEHGMFLWFQKGFHVYVPYDALEPAGSHQAIIDRINGTSA